MSRRRRHVEDEPDVLLGWGARAVEALSTTGGVTVVVDVLTFTTTVVEACAREALVYPCPWPGEEGRFLATEVGARLAASRDVAAEGFSLSPLSVTSLHPREKLVLPSPNGGAVSVAASTRTHHVLSATLANAAAVAAAAVSMGRRPITVIACGETWPSGRLEHAVEDFVGAGAVIAELTGMTVSQRAKAAVSHFKRARGSLEQELVNSDSGRRLIDRGFMDDVILSARYNTSSIVPALVDRAFSALQVTSHRDTGEGSTR